MTHITIGGDTFEVRVEGDATRPFLLLSNSLGTDLSLWDGQMAALLEHFRVIRYDTRGHGGSARGKGPISIARLGRDVLAILDALEIGTTHVLGLSMGGAIAQWLLAHAPARIDRVVLANTAAFFGPPEAWNARIATVLCDGMDAVADRTMERWFGMAFRAAYPNRVAPIHDRLRAITPESYAACCAALRDMDLRESSRGIDRQVLIVTGREDPVIAESDTAILLSAIEGAQHVGLDARHLSNIEAEGAFNEAVVAFLTAKIPVRKAQSRVQTQRKARATATRSSAARNPLKTVAAKPIKQKPATAKASAKTKVPVSSRRALASKPVATKTVVSKTTSKTSKELGAGKTITAKPASKRHVKPKTPAEVRGARKPATKAAVKKAVAKKTTPKTTPPARRATPINARGAIKNAVTKVKPQGKAVPKKAVVRKTAAKKTIANKKNTKKALVAKKTMPAPRRKPATKPRGPVARRRK